MNISNLLDTYSAIELLLFAAIAALLLLVFLLFCYAIILKIIYRFKERYKQRKFAVWEDIVLNQLYSGDFAHLFSMDAERQRVVFDIRYKDFRIFGEFIENYLFDLRGEEAGRIIALLRTIGFDRLLLKALDDPNKWNRAYAAHFAGLMYLTEGEERLVELVYDPAPVVYLNAFEALYRLDSGADLTKIVRNVLENERIGPTKVIEILLSFGEKIDPVLLGLLTDPVIDMKDRRLIVDVLAERGVYESVEPIRKIVRETNNEELKIGCIKALGSFEDPDSVSLLIGTLGSDNWVVRAQAAKSLGLIGDPAAVDPLVRLASGDTDYNVVIQSARALARINGGIKALERILDMPGGGFAEKAARYVLQEAIPE